MKWIPAAIPVLLSACATAPATRESDAATMRLLMGRNDRVKLEIQLLTAEPQPDKDIDFRIGKMIGWVREASHLRPFNDAAKNDLLPGLGVNALRDLESLRGVSWGPATREGHWAKLEAACATCHSRVR